MNLPTTKHPIFLPINVIKMCSYVQYIFVLSPPKAPVPQIPPKNKGNYERTSFHTALLCSQQVDSGYTVYTMQGNGNGGQVGRLTLILHQNLVFL